jgi:hypothetical protein
MEGAGGGPAAEAAAAGIVHQNKAAERGSLLGKKGKTMRKMRNKKGKGRSLMSVVVRG